MTKQYIDIASKWAIVLAYDIELRDLDEIASWLEALGCTKVEIRRACRVAMAINSGFTFSNPDLRMSVVCISQASSEEQWWETMVHELKHVQSHICEYYDVPENSEDAAYLIGYQMRQVLTRKKPPAILADGQQ